MKCSEIMTKDPNICFPEDNIQKAVGAMWDGDCGGIPVVNNSESKELIGMITDRDAAICVIKHMNMHPSNVKVKDCMSPDVFSCLEDDPVESVIQMMTEHQIRRIPIVDSNNCCVGIISQADLILHADEIGYEALISALQRISMPQMATSTV